jgi:hypothetical protein
MKRIFSIAIANSLCACVLIAGCAKAPQKEMSAASAAIESAKAAKAPIFAAEQFKSAQDKVDAAFADIKAQNAKMPFSRNYDKAKKMLAEATAATEAAKAAVAANKSKIEQEAKDLLDKTKGMVDESKKMVETLIKKKNKEAADLKMKLEAAAASLPSDLSKVTDDALIATRDVISSAMTSVESIKASIEQLGAAKPAAKAAPKKKGKGKK